MDTSPQADGLNSFAKRMARRLGRWTWLSPVLWRIPWKRSRAVARELDFERNRRRRIRSVMGRIQEIESEVALAEPEPSGAPIVLFNTTTSPGSISFTTMVGLLAGWMLRLGGRRVVHWVCHSGMSRCPQGTYRYAVQAPPPCRACRAVKDRLFPPALRQVFGLDPGIVERLPLPEQVPDLAELVGTTYKGIPIGEICLHTVRHVLRRHSLEPDERTVAIYRDFLLSAANIADRFEELLDAVRPQAAVMFNGVIFPEATAREVALRHGVPVVTYEVGFRERSAFFSHDLAPECRIDVPDGFELSPAESKAFDAYLARRFGGDFSMGGIRFWPQMTGLGAAFDARAAGFKRIVPVFTNTVFDTSQIAANTVFASMFEWLGATLEAGRRRPDTLFVVRAHPDEFRRGHQRSAELVGDWLEERGFLTMSNLLFIPPTQHASSYELLGRAAFCAVYNSTIGLEAALLGVPVLCGGRGKYSGTGFVQSFEGTAEYLARLDEMLAAEEIPWPKEWRDEARRFFYYLLFRQSLDLSHFIAAGEGALGPVFSDFDVEELRPDRSPEGRILFKGITKGEAFCYAGERGEP